MSRTTKKMPQKGSKFVKPPSGDPIPLKKLQPTPVEWPDTKPLPFGYPSVPGGEEGD